jgi:hypothetical protein
MLQIQNKANIERKNRVLFHLQQVFTIYPVAATWAVRWRMLEEVARRLQDAMRELPSKRLVQGHTQIGIVSRYECSGDFIILSMYARKYQSCNVFTVKLTTVPAETVEQFCFWLVRKTFIFMQKLHKGDPVALLKKQLEEKEVALKDGNVRILSFHRFSIRCMAQKCDHVTTSHSRIQIGTSIYMHGARLLQWLRCGISIRNHESYLN